MILNVFLMQCKCVFNVLEEKKNALDLNRIYVSFYTKNKDKTERGLEAI